MMIERQEQSLADEMDDAISTGAVAVFVAVAAFITLVSLIALTAWAVTRATDHPTACDGYAVSECAAAVEGLK